MNEYKKYNYENNYMKPLNIVNFNNYLKKLVLKKPILQVVNNTNITPSVKDKSSSERNSGDSLRANFLSIRCNKNISKKSNIPVAIPRLIIPITPQNTTPVQSPTSMSILKRTITHKNLYEYSEEAKIDDEIVNVNIVVEVNSINHLLELIEKYEINPKFRYNINMESLHKIKEPLTELNNMIGIKELKTNIVEQIIYFIQELHNNSHDFMHTVIYGPPGTGKTEIAKILGKIFSKIGLLSKDSFKKVTRSDLIAGYVGQTALKTRDVITDSLGGVLFIDEAYSLGNSEKKDSFSKECIDTLCEALSDHKQDLMVIIAGYENELNNCFFNYNQGLESRFAWRFKTDEYSGKDLHDIFIKKINEIEWSIYENEKKITPFWFEKNLEHFRFYGRDIESLLAKTKIAHSKRVFCKEKIEKKKLTIEDLDNGLKLYLKNNETQSVRDITSIKKQLQYSMYN
jgi:SpoVK/Ycf46/Vps4 family AAA+-type ATPase